MKKPETSGVFNMSVQRAAQWLCRHRRARPCSWLGRLSYLVWRAYENRNFDMQTNGEEWCLRQIGGDKLQAKCVFDVGANVGEWLLLCRQYLPGAAIHAFEIAPPVFDQLRKNVGDRPHIALNPVGLSDQEGELDIFYTDSSDQLTTAYRENFSEAFETSGAKRQAPQSIRARVIRGDDYAREQGISMIDFLKIDVEGMEESVLRGFSTMFQEHRIRLVQFEYNTTNIVSKFMLRDAHQFFTSLGYRLGKLYPNHVEFRDYHFRQEDFCGPNMIAVRKEDEELLKRLG
jgi:FkbM family methyltransferase